MKRLQSAGDCARWIDALYGRATLEEAPVLHVTAVWADPAGSLVTMRIGPATPRSAHDRFALGLARARCDAILTTGRILREEPRLSHRYLDDEAGERALAAWRRDTSGRDIRPDTVVLTSGRDIDFAHPIFLDGAPVTLFTGEASAARLREAAPSGVRVVGDPSPSPRRAIAFLRGEGRCVGVEAGATTTRELYREPVLVDELMLSTFLGGSLPDAVRGPALEVAGLLDAAFRCAAQGELEEASGPWRFARYQRPATG